MATEQHSRARAALNQGGDTKGRHSPLTWPHECEFVFLIATVHLHVEADNSGNRQLAAQRQNRKAGSPLQLCSHENQSVLSL